MNIQQIKASNPNASIWVSASAGTGKTKILTDRVLRLMLGGNSLDRILCLTFTNAAAAEMKERIVNMIFHWSSLPRAQLQETLKNVQGYFPNTQQLERAGMLYQEYLDSDSSINIQTIHSFCQKLLQQFPVEAGVSPNFRIIDESSQAIILAEIKNEIMHEESLLPISKYLVSNFHETIIDEIFSEIIANKDKINKIDKDGGPNIEELVCKLGNSDELTNQFSHNLLLQTILPQPVSLESLKKLFLTNLGEKRKRLSCKKIQKNTAQYQALIDLQDLFYQKYQLYKDQQVGYFSQLINILASRLIVKYSQLKSKKALLDYDDLINKAQSLLCDSDAREWILYKLDGFIDHLLIDEAQDTSNKQWQIVNALMSEFHSGQDLEQNSRTVFVVGDVKQSIFSFQGADIEMFAQVNLELATKMFYAKKEFKNIDLEISYRSAQQILDVVHAVFSVQKQRDPESFSIPLQNIKSHRNHLQGGVEIWPLTLANSQDEIFWPTDPQQISAQPKKILANNIAEYVRELIDSKMILASTGKAVECKDIMILFRRRDQLVYEVIDALQNQDLDVSGLDRINLQDDLSIQDLVSLARFVINPYDDLSLASLLRSPIVNVNDEILEKINRQKDGSIWKYLAQEQSRYRDIYDILNKFIILYQNLGSVNFFRHVVDVMGYRQILNMHNGPSSNDAINELLNIYENYCQQFGHSLTKFLFWLNKIDGSIKRENSGDNQIQIMTTHGAKGLQAPVVILCDTTSVPTEKSRLFWDEQNNMFVSKSSIDNNEQILLLKNHNQRKIYGEYLRLLYVGMTRAEERLIICGCSGQKEVSDKSWYNIVNHAMTGLAKSIDGKLIYGDYATPESNDTNKALPTKSIEYFTPKYFIDKQPFKLQAKSDASYDGPLSQNQHRHYGIIFHKILEDVISSNNFHKIKQHPLIASLSAHDQQKIHNSILKIEQNSEFMRMLQLPTYTEMEVGLELNGRAQVKRIDLLIQDRDEIIIIDYKTDSSVPSNVENIIPQKYMEQIEFYSKICQQIYPNRKIIAKILWLENGELMRV